MSIMDAMKESISNSYEYKAGYTQAKEEFEQKLEDILDELKGEILWDHFYHEGINNYVVPEDVIERKFEKAIKENCR